MPRYISTSEPPGHLVWSQDASEQWRLPNPGLYREHKARGRPTEERLMSPFPHRYQPTATIRGLPIRSTTWKSSPCLLKDFTVLFLRMIISRLAATHACFMTIDRSIPDDPQGRVKESAESRGPTKRFTLVPRTMSRYGCVMGLTSSMVGMVGTPQEGDIKTGCTRVL